MAVGAPDRVGLPLAIFVQAEPVRETPDGTGGMKRRFRAAPEVQQCFHATGKADFMPVVVVESMAACEAFTRHTLLFEGGNVRRCRTFVSMAAVRTGTALNLQGPAPCWPGRCGGNGRAGAAVPRRVRGRRTARR